jgi:hypothetical protein
MTYEHHEAGDQGGAVAVAAAQGLPDKTLFPILSAIQELPQAALVDAVDLLADGTSRQLGVVSGYRHRHVAVRFSSHGGLNGG